MALLNVLTFNNNNLTDINLSNLYNLQFLSCKNNLLMHLDLSQNPQLINLLCSNNSNLQTINFNNGTIQSFPPTQGPTENWTGLPNLSAICADNGEISSLQNYLISCGIPQPVNISTNCALNNDTFATNDFLVAPNPSDGIFNIQFGTTIAKGSVIVYSMLGQKLYERTIANEATTTLQVNELPSGSYLVSVQDENNIKNKIIVKK